MAWLKPLVITGTASENRHWISCATASATVNSSPGAPTCSAASHVAVENIDVADKTRIEKRRLIRRGLSAADQRTSAWCSIFFELFA